MEEAQEKLEHQDQDNDELHELHVKRTHFLDQRAIEHVGGVQFAGQQGAPFGRAQFLHSQAVNARGERVAEKLQAILGLFGELEISRRSAFNRRAVRR